MEKIWPDAKKQRVYTNEVTYSPAVVTAINKWSTAADLFWAATWGNKAKILLAPALGLNDFNVLPYSKNELAARTEEGGLNAITTCKGIDHLIAENIRDRPLIWIDANLDYFLLPGINYVRDVMRNDLFLVCPSRTANLFFESNDYGISMEG